MCGVWGKRIEIVSTARESLQNLPEGSLQIRAVQTSTQSRSQNLQQVPLVWLVHSFRWKRSVRRVAQLGQVHIESLAEHLRAKCLGFFR